ncbi:MAG: Lipoprotein signal peptidase [Chlamydiales bacterium]|nr:Lipoprotein signal peptidase [Chlamydiales bacterium]
MINFFLKKYGYVAGLVFLGLSVLLLDFLSKAYVYHVLPFYDACTGLRCYEIPVFNNFLGVDFSIGLAFNRGAAWGMFANFQIVLLVIRMGVILGMLVYLFFLNQNRAADVPLVLIVSGAIGNVVDFFLYGFVIDFLQFNFWGYRFAVFNLADTAITIGVVGLFIVALCTRYKRKTHHVT